MGYHNNIIISPLLRRRVFVYSLAKNTKKDDMDIPRIYKHFYRIFISKESWLFGALVSSCLLLLTNVPLAEGQRSTPGRTTPVEESAAVNSGDRLILTPFLNNGSAREGRELSRVKNMASTESYSGFLIVNDTFNSNIFFWFFPAQYQPKTAPIILWLGGGPGVTTLYGLFNANGPFFVDDKNVLHRRDSPWSLTHSLLYMDSLVGAGFSFTEDEAGYARTVEDVSRDLYTALVQFFQLFPDFQSREFYIAGESYAAKYVLAVAYKIHKENLKSPFIPINLRGLAMGAPFIDPYNQLDYGNFFYNIGLIGEQEQSFFHELEKVTLDLIRKQRWADAFKVGESLMVGYPLVAPSYFKNVTGFRYIRNYHQAVGPEDRHYFINYLEQDHIRRAIHVGNQQFSNFNDTVYYAMHEDVYQSAKFLLEELLDTDNNYKVLIYTGQLDALVPHTTVTTMIKSLKWSGSPEFHLADRVIWRVNNDVAGYTKTVKNLVYLIMRNAGNVAGYDQPLWTFDMVNRFTV